MIYFTGDTHGIEFKKLNNKNFLDHKITTKNDYVIIAGDFGLVWNNSNEEKHWIKWLNSKSFTTLFVDGNHENHEKLNQYPIEIWNGGKVHKISDSIIHLMRGQVYTINDKKIFTFGGANSVDKEWRKENISWWPQEMPNTAEYEEGLKNLEQNNWEVDYIVTHTCPSDTVDALSRFNHFHPEKDSLTEYFNLINEQVKYKHWYFGHFHKDIDILDNQTVLYNDIIKII
jgi:predicted phosphodiesterase